MSRASTKLLLLAALACITHSCFTGIESTPRIGESELRRQHVTTTPEQRFLSDVAAGRPSLWRSGKEFYVTDSKISLIFTSASTGTGSLEGEVIRFCRFDSVPAVDSHSAAEAVLTHGADTLRWRPGCDMAELAARTALDIPFTVDLDLVAEIRPMLTGNTYYITSPLWYEPETLQPTGGLRHVPVRIADVQPGTADMPFKVIFTVADGGSDTTRHCVLMTIGDGRLATRNFDRLFAFGNPRQRYPAITDDVWDFIIHSRVRAGMSRDECRLALGSPLNISYGSGNAATAEIWYYPDGVYLIFDDGFLSRFRL